MKTGIYKIRNVWTGDCYIGSAKSFITRWQRHRKDLRKGKHHSQYLQRAWDKYGENSFVFGVIEYTDQLCDRENYFLRLERPVYNMCPEAYSQVGRKLSDVHVQKLKKYAQQHGSRPPKETYEGRYLSVVMLNYETLQPIQTFKSLSEACFHIGKDYTYVSTIAAAARGIRKSAFGYKWKMFENENQRDSRVKH